VVENLDRVGTAPDFLPVVEREAAQRLFLRLRVVVLQIDSARQRGGAGVAFPEPRYRPLHRRTGRGPLVRQLGVGNNVVVVRPAEGGPGSGQAARLTAVVVLEI